MYSTIETEWLNVLEPSNINDHNRHENRRVTGRVGCMVYEINGTYIVQYVLKLRDNI